MPLAQGAGVNEGFVDGGGWLWLCVGDGGGGGDVDVGVGTGCGVDVWLSGVTLAGGEY